jgi:hypothetical protein
MIYIHACAVPSRRSIYLSISIYLSCYGNVLLRVVIVSLALSLVESCFFMCLSLPEDRAFEPVREMVVRSIISIVGSSRRDRDAERNSFPVFS